LSLPKFVTFSAWRAGTMSRYSTGESPPIKAGNHTWRLHAKRTTPSGRRRRSSARFGRSQQLWTLPSQTVRGFFCVCANILSAPAFVDAKILSTPGFCRRPYFVNANILSTPVFFCRRPYFVDANIFSAPVFCRRQ
jgi:hypothetical protein